MPEVNTRISPPFGDIFFPTTPYGDKLTDRLYLEQKQREAEKKRQADQLDAEFAKNVSAMRDADVDDVVKLYGDWKAATLQSMKKKGGISPQEQLKLLKMKGDVNRQIELSKRGYAEEEDLKKDYLKNADDYDDNAPTLLAERRKRPMNQLNTYKNEKGETVDLGDLKTYMYKGINTDFGKEVADAFGTGEEIVLSKQKRKEGDTFITPVYKYGKNPLQVKERLLGGFALRKAGRDAERQWDLIPEEEKKETIIAFNATPPEKWERIGLDGPQDLTPKNPDSKAEKLASYLAMKNFLATEPKEGRPITLDDKAAIDERNFEQAKKLKALDFAYDKMLASFKTDQEAAANAWIAEDVQAKIKAAVKPENRVAYKDETGKWQEGYNIPNTTEYRKAFSVTVDGKTVEPDAIRFNPEDASITPVFWKYEGGKPLREGPGKGIEVIDYPLTSKHSFSDAVVTLGGKAGMKQKNIEGSTIYGKAPTPGKRTSAYIYKGKKYTPEQIEKAAKQNNMTIDQYIKAAGIE